MNKKIIFNITPKYRNTLLLEDNKIVEYHQEQSSQSYNVGDVYLATVKKIAPSLNAAFVDIGDEKMAFLHYSDMSPYMRTLQKLTHEVLHNGSNIPNISHIAIQDVTDKNGKIENNIKEKEKIIVQISKEAISTKGIRITSCISLAGRYLILVPFENGITISKKITNKVEKSRLRKLIKSIKPKNFGVIVRTLAEKKEAALLDSDLRELLERWEKGVENLAKAKNKSSISLIKQPGPASSILRDIFNEKFSQVVVDDVSTYNEIKEYVSKILPDKSKIVHLYQGQHTIFEYLGIDQKIKNLLSEVVSLPGGGYLIIEHTEAMHVIDVNTGNRVHAGVDQEALAFEVNMVAAEEIARQMRLRNMGGIIIVDFIGMRNYQNKRALYEAIKQFVKNDRFQPEIIPLSRFGVMEITRPRVRPALRIPNQECCSTCYGTGKVQSSMGVPEQLEGQLQNILKHKNINSITVYIHPFLYAHINRGFLPKTWKWRWRYKKSIKIKEDPNLAITDYRIVNTQNHSLLAEAPKLNRAR
ncbi:MAG: Rne/Rng family ribonuclease [Bacteroidota bacterium]